METYGTALCCFFKTLHVSRYRIMDSEPESVKLDWKLRKEDEEERELG